MIGITTRGDYHVWRGIEYHIIKDCLCLQSSAVLCADITSAHKFVGTYR